MRGRKEAAPVKMERRQGGRGRRMLGREEGEGQWSRWRREEEVSVEMEAKGSGRGRRVNDVCDGGSGRWLVGMKVEVGGRRGEESGAY